MTRRSVSWFHRTTLAVLLTFAGTIALILAADVAYVITAAPDTAQGDASMLQALASSRLRDVFVLSMVTSVIATVLSILVAVPSGYALSRFPFRGMIIADVIVDVLIVLPVLVIGISLLVFFREGDILAKHGVSLLVTAMQPSGTGALGHLWPLCLSAAGYLLFAVGYWITTLGSLFIYQRAGIVLAMFFCSASFAVRVMKATFDELDPRTEQVAMTLGCSRAGAFWRVTLPLARHGIFAAAVLAWVRAIGLFGPVQIVAGTVRGRTEVLSTGIFLEITIGQLKLALAMSLLMIVMAFLVLIALRVLSRSSLFGAGGS